MSHLPIYYNYPFWLECRLDLNTERLRVEKNEKAINLLLDNRAEILKALQTA